MPVFLESVGIHQKKFKVTNKNKENSDTTNFRFMIPHLILTGLSVAAILKFLYGKYGTALALSSVIIFWLFYNLRALIFSIFFMMGRRTYRKYERIRADEKVTVTVHGRKYEGRSVDLSEDGIAFRLEKSFYIPDDEAFDLLIETPYYRANLSAQLVYMKEADSAYHYAARVKPVSENDWRQYLQVIHDRLHTHPVELDLWMTSYDDILRNIRKRCEKTFLQQRKALRIPIEREISFSQGARAYVVDFNYHYLAVSRLWAGQWDEVTPLRWDLNGYTLYLQKKELDKRNIILLEIKNMLPELRVLQWSCDWIVPGAAKRNIAALKKYSPAVDVMMITTGDKKLLSQFVTGKNRVAYLPNIADKSIEDGQAFTLENPPFDIMLAASTGLRQFAGKDEQIEDIVDESSRKVPGLKWKLAGIKNNPGLNGYEYIDALKQSAMGLNLSRRNDIYHYSSDRLAHIMANGGLAFIDRRTGFDDMFDESEAAFYFSREEFFDKLDFFKRNPRQRMENARRGYEKIHREFNEKVIAGYMADLLFGEKSEQKSWKCEID